DVPDGRVVELAQCLGLPQKPRAAGLVPVEVDPYAYPSLERLVARLEQDAVLVRAGDPLQPVARAERGRGALERQDGIGRAHRGNRRRRSMRLSWPQAAGSHHNRLLIGDWSVKNREQPSPAQRRTAMPGSASVAAADRAIASSTASGWLGANLSRHSPATRVSCWLPPLRPSSSLTAAMEPAGGWPPSCRASARSVSRVRSSSALANGGAPPFVSPAASRW